MCKNDVAAGFLLFWQSLMEYIWVIFYHIYPGAIYFWDRVSLCLWLSWIFLWKLGWPQNHRHSLASAFLSAGIKGIHHHCVVPGTILIVMYFKKRLSHRNALKDVLLILAVSATQEEYVIIIIIIIRLYIFHRGEMYV